MSEAPSPRPKRPHPTAKALFDQFDQKGGNRQSELIRKQSQSLGWRNRFSQSEYYPLSILGTKFSVRQIQRGEVEGDFGTGATVWPASVVLSKYLEKHGDLLIKGKTVVDLGAGTGITSIAAGLLGASNVVCTDGSQPVVDLAIKNVKEACQQLEGRLHETTVSPCYYWWASRSLKEQFDVILVGDCVLPKLYPIEPLVEALDELLRENGLAVLSYEHRHYADFHPKTRFYELAEAKGFSVSTVPQTELDPVYSLHDVEIWQVRRNP